MPVQTGSFLQNTEDLIENDFINLLGFPVVGLQKLGEQSYGHLVYVFVDFLMIVFLFESQQIENVLPLALLLDVVDVVVDEMDEVVLVECESVVPLAVDDAPDVHLLLLGALNYLDLVVEVLYGGEAALAVVQAIADLALALLLHLDVEGLLAFPAVDPRHQVD